MTLIETKAGYLNILKVVKMIEKCTVLKCSKIRHNQSILKEIL